MINLSLYLINLTLSNYFNDSTFMAFPQKKFILIVITARLKDHISLKLRSCRLDKMLFRGVGCKKFKGRHIKIGQFYNRNIKKGQKLQLLRCFMWMLKIRVYH